MQAISCINKVKYKINLAQTIVNTRYNLYIYIIKLKQRYENENQQIATFQNGMGNV